MAQSCFISHEWATLRNCNKKLENSRSDILHWKIYPNKKFYFCVRSHFQLFIVDMSCWCCVMSTLVVRRFVRERLDVRRWCPPRSWPAQGSWTWYFKVFFKWSNALVLRVPTYTDKTFSNQTMPNAFIRSFFRIFLNVHTYMYFLRSLYLLEV